MIARNIFGARLVHPLDWSCQNGSMAKMTFSAVLLAGGESRRMGRDKATIVFHGCPLWQRQLQVLRDLGPEKIFVSARKLPSWLPFDTELLLDEPPFRGPLSGLTRALTSIRTSHLAVLAVDMPSMTSAQLQALLGQARPRCGVVPVVEKRAEPLAATASCQPECHGHCCPRGPGPHNCRTRTCTLGAFRCVPPQTIVATQLSRISRALGRSSLT